MSMLRRSRTDIYGGKRPGDLPVYSIREAAHCLQLPPATVRSWAIGREYPTQRGTVRFRPVIAIADSRTRNLSFLNLIELHVLSSLRQRHKVRLKEVRRAIRFLMDRFDSDHPLLEQEMLTDGKDLFIEKYGTLINVSQGGQQEMKSIIEVYLKRIERDADGVPVRLFPFSRPRPLESPRFVSIDPRIRFGKPCIAGTSIPTLVVAERHKAGDSISFLAQDYGREEKEIEEAIRYESRVAS